MISEKSGGGGGVGDRGSVHKHAKSRGLGGMLPPETVSCGF